MSVESWVAIGGLALAVMTTVVICAVWIVKQTTPSPDEVSELRLNTQAIKTLNDTVAGLKRWLIAINNDLHRIDKRLVRLETEVGVKKSGDTQMITPVSDESEIK